MEGKFTGIRYMHARADIEAVIWYSKKEKVYLNQEIETKTGLTEKKYSVNINNFKINLWKRVSKFEKYDTIIENKKIALFNNFYLPINIEIITNIEKEIQNITYGKDELKNMTIERIEKELEDQIENKEQIINKQVNYSDGETFIEVEIIYEVKEAIGAKEKIIF